MKIDVTRLGLLAIFCTSSVVLVLNAHAKPSWQGDIKDPAVMQMREAVYSALWDHAAELAKTNKRVDALEVKVSKLLKAALHNNERVIKLEAK